MLVAAGNNVRTVVREQIRDSIAELLSSPQTFNFGPKEDAVVDEQCVEEEKHGSSA